MASFMPDPELEDRRLLLQAAARGSVRAQLKLQEEYHVRVYSSSEREQYAGTLRLDHTPSAIRRKIDQVIGNTEDH
jgi:DNA-binding GntR family transcriptional regulator